MFTKIGRRSIKYCKSYRLHSSQSYLNEDTATPKNNQEDYFNQFKNQWWNETGYFKPLHSMNKLRVPFIRDGLINAGLVKSDLVNTPRPLTKLEILEVGCGGGILTEALARLGCHITGIDTANELIELAKQHCATQSLSNNINYHVSTIENFSETNIDKFDAVVASEVLEHVNEKELFLESCIKCLKPQGSIFITTLNQTSLAWICAIVIAENVLKLLPQGTHEYNNLVPLSRLQKILEHNNCRTRVIHGMCYNFLTDNWSWTSDTSINYAVQAIKN